MRQIDEGVFMEYRVEKDTMGEINVPNTHYWGAQTQRSLEHFAIGVEKMPKELIKAFALLKRSLATINQDLGKLKRKKHHKYKFMMLLKELFLM